MTTEIGIIGAGAWGTAIAQTLAVHGQTVTLWARRADIISQIRDRRENPNLVGERLHDNIIPTNNYADLDACKTIIYVLPAQALRDHLILHTPKPHQTLVIAAKGIELNTGKLLSEVVADITPNTKIAFLTGPNFAREVAHNLPAASTIACADQTDLSVLQAQLATKTFRLYPTTDIIGAQCGGAVKNVIALACGVVDGLKLGDNARAALITRGLAEIARLTTALGGQRETLMGLCGLGDLILTCTSVQSRNYRFGLALADGDPHDLTTTTTVEGVHTAQALMELGGRLHIEMPICVAVAACLSGHLSVQQAVDKLLQRPARNSEQD